MKITTILSRTCLALAFVLMVLTLLAQRGAFGPVVTGRSWRELDSYIDGEKHYRTLYSVTVKIWNEYPLYVFSQWDDVYPHAGEDYTNALATAKKTYE